MKGALLAVGLLLSAVPAVGAVQDSAAARADYLSAVARFFEIPPEEVAILGDWEIELHEIPVVLFVASRAGVSAEALIVLRSSGRDWAALSRRYRVSAEALHLPLRDRSAAGALRVAYERFDATPVAEWPSMDLTENEIVALINVRVIAGELDLAIDDVARHTADVTSFVELFARLRR